MVPANDRRRTALVLMAQFPPFKCEGGTSLHGLNPCGRGRVSIGARGRERRSGLDCCERAPGAMEVDSKVLNIVRCIRQNRNGFVPFFSRNIFQRLTWCGQDTVGPKTRFVLASTFPLKGVEKS